ncbi:uncharacterized protein B0I36DRAFT_368855 [Microdochium trichocladiopsis]|uniref:Uncharacterized protein n=1 Tax=Microdochium trichocladiopsis TaxID=1682393 RepID=A0A9P8XSV4_9PEZI|nr:uncharacterized protein B0I36DRAFT_368855 [Microdochium trichocladiopsis]KAH7016303.1 hypothetical protein B0I36DRAFT_368855 [Microdochium trichocladiopsis]
MDGTQVERTAQVLESEEQMKQAGEDAVPADWEAQIARAQQEALQAISEKDEALKFRQRAEDGLSSIGNELKILEQQLQQVKADAEKTQQSEQYAKTEASKCKQELQNLQDKLYQAQQQAKHANVELKNKKEKLSEAEAELLNWKEQFRDSSLKGLKTSSKAHKIILKFESAVLKLQGEKEQIQGEYERALEMANEAKRTIKAYEASIQDQVQELKSQSCAAQADLLEKIRAEITGLYPYQGQHIALDTPRRIGDYLRHIEAQKQQTYKTLEILLQIPFSDNELDEASIDVTRIPATLLESVKKLVESYLALEGICISTSEELQKLTSANVDLRTQLKEQCQDFEKARVDLKDLLLAVSNNTVELNHLSQYRFKAWQTQLRAACPESTAGGPR